MGCTSGAPSLHDGIHFWWPVLHGLHFWCPIPTWRDPLLVARSSWAALLVPHSYLTGSTSGGLFFMGCTSGVPFLHDRIHFWWLVLHGPHFWCPISIWRDPLLVACSSWAILLVPHLYVTANHALQVCLPCVCENPRVPSRFPPLSIIPILFVLEDYPTWVPMASNSTIQLPVPGVYHPSTWTTGASPSKLLTNSLVRWLFQGFVCHLALTYLHGFHISWTHLQGFHTLWPFLHWFHISQTYLHGFHTLWPLLHSFRSSWTYSHGLHISWTHVQGFHTCDYPSQVPHLTDLSSWVPHIVDLSWWFLHLVARCFMGFTSYLISIFIYLFILGEYDLIIFFYAISTPHSYRAISNIRQCQFSVLPSHPSVDVYFQPMSSWRTCICASFYHAVKCSRLWYLSKLQAISLHLFRPWVLEHQCCRCWFRPMFWTRDRLLSWTRRPSHKVLHIVDAELENSNEADGAIIKSL